jgi:hypothetical protein
MLNRRLVGTRYFCTDWQKECKCAHSQSGHLKRPHTWRPLVLLARDNVCETVAKKTLWGECWNFPCLHQGMVPRGCTPSKWSQRSALKVTHLAWNRLFNCQGRPIIITYKLKTILLIKQNFHIPLSNFWYRRSRWTKRHCKREVKQTISHSLLLAKDELVGQDKALNWESESFILIIENKKYNSWKFWDFGPSLER